MVEQVGITGAVDYVSGQLQCNIPLTKFTAGTCEMYPGFHGSRHGADRGVQTTCRVPQPVDLQVGQSKIQIELRASGAMGYCQFQLLDGKLVLSGLAQRVAQVDAVSELVRLHLGSAPEVRHGLPSASHRCQRQAME